MAYSMKKFAHFLVIQYSNLPCMDPDLIKFLCDFKKEEPTKHVCNSIDKLLECYKIFIDLISIEDFHEFAHNELMTKPEYAKFLIKGCSKLCEKERTFFEFLLVCVYICKMSNILYARYKCCKILKVTANTLELLYTKQFSNFFKAKGGFSEFSTFCKYLNDCPTSESCAPCADLNIFFSFIERESNFKVRNFKYLDYSRDFKEVNLGDEDLKFLEDEPYLKANNRGHNYLLDWGHNPESMEKKKDSDSEVDITEFDAIPEKAYKTGLRCDYCLSKCFQYPLYCKKYEIEQQF